MIKKLLIGGHLSIAGGFWKSVERANQIGATCLQIFTKITDEDIEKFLEARKRFNIDLVVAHASYLINLGSENIDVQEKSIKALADEINRCELLQIPFLVLHPGSNRSENKLETCKLIAENINKVFKIVNPKTTMILLETMAGQGSTVGKHFEDLAEIIKHITLKKNIGICVDTCHIFAAGYEFEDEKSYKELWKNFNKIIGLEKIKVIHMNDSKKDFNSNVDRHEHIGKGKINNTAFKLIMNDKNFKDVAKIIETPKSTESLDEDIKNLETLKSYIKK